MLTSQGGEVRGLGGPRGGRMGTTVCMQSLITERFWETTAEDPLEFQEESASLFSET